MSLVLGWSRSLALSDSESGVLCFDLGRGNHAKVQGASLGYCFEQLSAAPTLMPGLTTRRIRVASRNGISNLDASSCVDARG